MRSAEELLRRAEELGVEVPAGVSPPELEALVTQAERRQYCPQCGALAQADSGFCSGCGVALARPALNVPGASAGNDPTVASQSPRFSYVTPGKTSAVRVFMFITGGLNLAAAAATVNEISKFSAWWAAPATKDLRQFSDWADAEALSRIAIGVALISAVVLWILLMVWSNRAYKDLLPLEAVGRSWGPGWAVGGWLIPIANLFIPKMVVNEIDRISAPTNTYPVGGAWRSNRVLPDGNWWWGLVVTGWVVSGWASIVALRQVEAVAFSAGIYRTALWFVAGALVVEGVGWFYGARYFRALGARFHG